MADGLDVMWLLAIGLSVASLAGFVAQKLKVSPILGYLFAGFLIGPNSPGYMADQAISDELSNIGITLLMFAVGLNFSWKDINAYKHIVIPGAVTLSLLSIAAGTSLVMGLGDSALEGLVVGIAVCVSSTVVIVRVLSDQNLLKTKQGYLVVGWTIVEDLVSVVGLILLPALVIPSGAGDAHPLATIAQSIMITIVKVTALGLIVYFLGERCIAKLLKIIARTRSHELFTLAVLSCVFLIALGSTYFFGISLALGAFIAGTIIGNTDMSHQAAANALPMRDAFAVIFFLSVGMLFDPFALQGNLPLFLGILAILLLFRPLIAYGILKIAKYPSYVGFTVAIAISQIGEYSFILAEEGSRLNILPDNAFDIIIACAFISIALNPILFQLFKGFMNPRAAGNVKLQKEPGLTQLYEPPKGDVEFLPKALVIGFGPVGQAACAELEGKYRILVIDQNIDTVSEAVQHKVEMIFGDATQLQIMERANIANVALVVITTPDTEVTKTIIHTVQQANPNASIIARVHFLSESEQLHAGPIPIVCDEQAAAEKIANLIQNYT
ncbi:MAG: cation:proton antiporter [Parachlamydiaceae bacterium]